MKNLLIIRHATSESQGTDGTDFTRPLTALGEEEAAIQGRFLRESGIIPPHIAASSALRARRTAEILAESMGSGPELVFLDDLYNAPGVEILEQVRQLPGNIDTALVVAHMPGVAELLDMLTTDFAEVAVAFSPATMTGVSFNDPVNWTDIAPDAGILEWLLPPLIVGR